MTGDVETYYEDGTWRNWADGEDLGRPHRSRDEAVTEGREEAAHRRVAHIVRDEQATIIKRSEQG